MKTQTIQFISALFVLGSLTLVSCTENENILDTNVQTEMQSNLVSVQITEYYSNLIEMTDAAEANAGSTVSLFKLLKSKVENAAKHLEQQNTEAAVNQLQLFKKQVQNLINKGDINQEEGSQLINHADNAILLTRGSFTDERDGNVYDVVLIGEQIWMAENLAYLPRVTPFTDFNDPFALKSAYTPGSYYVYGYNEDDITQAKQNENYSKYGVLYDWDAAATASPDGWHLPANEEWEQLLQYVSNAKNVTPENAAGYLKATYDWIPNDGTDDFGFSALAGGNVLQKGLV